MTFLRIPYRGIRWLNCILVFVTGRSQCDRVSRRHPKHRGAAEWRAVSYWYAWHVYAVHIIYQYHIAFHISQRLCSAWPKPTASACLWDTPHWYEWYNWIGCREALSDRCVCVCVFIWILFTLAPDIFIQVPEVWTWGTWKVKASDVYPHHASTAPLPCIQPQTKNIKHSLLIVAICSSGGGHTVGRWLMGR